MRTRPPGRVRASVASAAERSAASTPPLPPGTGSAGPTSPTAPPASSRPPAASPAAPAPPGPPMPRGLINPPRPAPAAARLDGRGHARLADRVLRVARERRPMHRHAADHLAPLLGRPSHLGNGRQDEGLTNAEDVHRGVDLGTERAAEPRVDL